LTLEVLQQVALAYLNRDAGQTLPLWQTATLSVDDLRARADAVVAATRRAEVADVADVAEVVECAAAMGGGTLPGVSIPSCGVAVAGDVTAALRAWSPPVIARVRDGRTVCDLRTVLPHQDVRLAAALAACG
jgi:L-seryl-tRNA(Ser) seleniumtransferase